MGQKRTLEARVVELKNKCEAIERREAVAEPLTNGSAKKKSTSSSTRASIWNPSSRASRSRKTPSCKSGEASEWQETYLLACLLVDYHLLHPSRVLGFRLPSELHARLAYLLRRTTHDLCCICAALKK